MAARGSSFEVVIAGAGPVGLLFAAQLVRSQQSFPVRLRIVDVAAPRRWTAEQTDVRVYALSRESQLLFGDLWREIESLRVSPYRRMHVFEGDSFDGGASISFDAADVGEPDLGHIVEDSLLRTVLLDYLAAAEVEMEFGAAVQTLSEDRGKTHLGLEDGTTLTADLVVGADGGDSAVRAAAGIDVIRKDYSQRAIVSHVTTGLPHQATAWQRFLPDGPLAFLPLADGRSSIVWTNRDAAAERLLEMDDDAFLDRLSQASTGVLGSLGPCSTRRSFPLRLQHAVRYTEPGIALIGDAAHAVHPLAGQGMNLGLRDAAVLAEVLASAAASGEHPADEFVLRRYERKQKAHNLVMQLAFDGINELFGRSLPDWATPLRGAGLAAVNRAAPARRLLMRRALGLDRLPGNPGSHAGTA